MKNYTITVNGNVYNVTVEESGSGATVAAPKKAVAAPAAKPAKAAAPAGANGSIVIDAKAAGKVYSIDSVEGQAVKRGDTILVLEVMKMETPVVAPQDGTVASINVAKGDSIEVGAVLATMN